MEHIRFILILSIVLLGSGKNLIAQSDFYAIDHVPEIRLYFSQPDWDEILDSLYIVGSEVRLGADVTIDGIAYDKVGVRYKGFSSYSSNRDKNPFNIDLDYVFSEQNHQGYNKIKLSNVIQDPSFVRETLSYEIARKYMPASLANYANVYVNDTLIGLYTNVEAVAGNFLSNHFSSEDNTFVKCNPETVDLNGENSNLSDSPGEDISNYYSLYDMKSTGKEDWDNLYELIDILNNAPSDIEDLLNVDRTLWMHALNYAMINFDSYVGYAQNYYLYKDDNGRFNPVLWDLNMSFASYRFTDASDNWDGFSIAEAKIIDPLQHLNSFSVHPRPLIRNLLENDTYKRMYLAHLRTIMEENFENQEYYTRAQYMQNIIDAYVQADTNKFYGYTDFIENLDTTVSDLIDYPGIRNLMEDRTTYLSTYPGMQLAPDISGVGVSPQNTVAGDDVGITATVTSGYASDVYLAYRFSASDLFTVVPMYDDGNHDDGASGDNVYGAYVQNISNLVQYYIYAENDSSGRFSPERAAYTFYEHESKIRPGDLVINEVMSDNILYSDEYGDYDDWFEIFNTTDFSISMGGMYLSDEADNLMKWPVPYFEIESGRYLVIWADGEPSQGANHAFFDLDNMGDTLWLSYGDGTVIDSVVIEEQYEVTSLGRYPNGTGDFIEMRPTPGAMNENSDHPVLSDQLYIYPNPAGNEINIKLNTIEAYELQFVGLDGRKVAPNQVVSGEGMITFDTSLMADGVYLVQLSYGEEYVTKKIMITH